MPGLRRGRFQIIIQSGSKNEEHCCMNDGRQTGKYLDGKNENRELVLDAPSVIT